METNLPLGPLGLYIHIPWCITRCGYCVFYSLNYRRQDFDAYFELLLKEKQQYLNTNFRPLCSIYLGGGTPSLLSYQQILRLLDGIPVLPNAEITLEINPIQITQNFVHNLAQTPINRLSLGVQSMHDDDLAYLDRRHKANDILPKMQLLRDAGFNNISVDFIYGLPHNNREKTIDSLSLLLNLFPNHISCYLLEIDPKSRLAPDIQQIPDDETLADIYHSLRLLLAKHGYMQYEISNFARLGYQSRHNLLYWNSDEYLAWGASAAGFYRGLRYQNPSDLHQYETLISSHKLYGITDKGASIESDYIMMRLRMVKGLDFKEFTRRFHKDFSAIRKDQIHKWKNAGFISVDTNGLRLNDKGYFISNAIIADLL